MQIKAYIDADKDVICALQRLIHESAEADGYATEIDIDMSMNAVKDMRCLFACEEGGRLVGLLFVFAPGREDAEINALVHPAHRRKGCFKALLKEAVTECSRYGYKQGLFVLNSASRDGKAIIEHWGCGTDHVELQMECDIAGSTSKPADIEVIETKESDLEELSVIGAAAFNMDIESEKEHIRNTLAAPNRIQYAVRRQGSFTAMSAASAADGRMMVFGLGVHPDERRRGYAKALLNHTANEALRRGINKLGLDVDEENEGARALYESYGFVCTGRTEYRTFYFDSMK